MSYHPVMATGLERDIDIVYLFWVLSFWDQSIMKASIFAQGFKEKRSLSDFLSTFYYWSF